MAFSTEPASSSALWKYSNTDVQMHSYWRGAFYPAGAGWTASSGRMRDPSGRWFGITYDNSYRVGNNYDAITWPFNSPGYGLANIRPNLDGSYPLLPVFISSDNGPVAGVDVNTWGEFDGVFATTGHGFASENTITQGLLTHVAFQDVFRVVKDSFCAIALD